MFGGNGRVLVLAQGFFDLLLDLQQGSIQRWGLCGNFGEVHTLSTDLAGVAKKANPKLLVTYHRIYHMNIQDNHKNLAAEMAWRDTAILDEIRDAGYDGYVVNGKDLDVF